MESSDYMVTILPIQIDAAVGAPTVGTAVKIESAREATLSRAFLGKHLVLELVLDAPDSLDTLLIAMAQGLFTVAQLAAAVTSNAQRDDPVEENIAKRVLWETMVLMANDDGSGTGSKNRRIDVSLGGGKGIPFAEDRGWQIFVMNVGVNDQVAGTTIIGHGYMSGVWL